MNGFGGGCWVYYSWGGRGEKGKEGFIPWKTLAWDLGGSSEECVCVFTK